MTTSQEYLERLSDLKKRCLRKRRSAYSIQASQVAKCMECVVEYDGNIDKAISEMIKRIIAMDELRDPDKARRCIVAVAACISMAQDIEQ